MRRLERRLQAAEDGLIRKDKGELPKLYVRYVEQEDLRPYGASDSEQERYSAIIDGINAYVDDLVRQHGRGILRSHHIAYLANDAYNELTLEDLEFMDYLLKTYRPDDDEAA